MKLPSYVKDAVGFTLIELLVAMSVFSFMLLIVSTGFINIVKINQATNASRLTQQSARLILETIERQLRVSSQVVVAVDATDPNYGRLCLYNNSEYIEYFVDTAGNLRQGTVSNLAACDTAPSPSLVSSASKLNTNNVASGATDGVKVRRFLVSTSAIPGSNGGLVTIELSMTGQGVNDSELNATKTGCKPGPGSQFCSVTTLVTSAQLRGGTEQ